MTISELYDIIGGNYAHAVQIMRKDKMIHKYILKLSGSNAYPSLMAAAETMDPASLFDSAHALKGVCANLGLDALSEAASAIADEFRAGQSRSHTDDEVRAMIARVDALYQKTIEGIRQYEATQA